VHENLILKWLEINYSKIHPLQERRIKNFDTEFFDGHIIAAIIQAYIGQNNELTGLKMNCSLESEFVYNAQKIINVLGQIDL